MPRRREHSRKAAGTEPHRPRSARPRRRAAEDFGDLFENANDIILMNDRDGRIVAGNRAAREFGGYTTQDVERGVDLSDVMPADAYAAAMVLTQRAFDGLPFPEVYEREAILRDGRRRVLELRSNVLRRRGRPDLLQTIGRDITEKKEAQAFQAGLLQASQALLNAQSVEQLWNIICEEAGRFLQVESVYLWLKQGDELVGCAAVGHAAVEFLGRRYALRGTLLQQFERHSGVLLINDFQQSPLADQAGLEAGVKSTLIVLLRRAAGPVGLLVLADYEHANYFTPTLGDRAMIFGAQITEAIESALARQREEEEGRVSAALLHVTQAIRESLEEVDVLPRIARSAREVVECDWSAVGLLNTAKTAFRVTTTEGWPPHLAEELQLIDLAPEVFPFVEPLLNSQTVEITAPQIRLDLWEHWRIGSLLAVPMVRAGRVVGVLALGHRVQHGPFSTRERRIAEGIAAQAAVAVDNARLVEDLRRANQLKSEFLGTMSHELRTPLSAILGYAELMRDGAMGRISHEQTDVLDRMLLNGRGLLELINMTLDVNRLESGRITLDPSEFALDDVLTELRNEFITTPTANGVAVSWPAPIGLPRLYTDRSKLKLVLRNLIDNALKFTPDGSIVVTASANRDLDNLCVSVQDTGVGIAREAFGEIFDMFHQIDAASASRRGVGLGLYLVRRYTTLMGGEVTVESTPGSGSTFTIEIPRVLIVADPDA